MKKLKKSIAKVLIFILILATQLYSPLLVQAAVEQVISWTGVNWPGINAPHFEVTPNIYLLRTFNTSGNLYFGEAGWSVGGGIFVTSTDFVNWEVQSRTFGMVYYEGMMYAIFHGGIYRTDTTLSWTRLDLPGNIQPTEISVESGFLRLNYRVQDSLQRGVMLSRDGNTWHDLRQRLVSDALGEQFVYGDVRGLFAPISITFDGNLLTWVDIEEEFEMNGWSENHVTGRRFYELNWQSADADWQELVNLRLEVDNLSVTDGQVSGLGHSVYRGNSVSTSLYMMHEGWQGNQVRGSWPSGIYAASFDMASWQVVYDSSELPVRPVGTLQFPQDVGSHANVYPFDERLFGQRAWGTPPQLSVGAANILRDGQWYDPVWYTTVYWPGTADPILTRITQDGRQVSFIPTGTPAAQTPHITATPQVTPQQPTPTPVVTAPTPATLPAATGTGQFGGVDTVNWRLIGAPMTATVNAHSNIRSTPTSRPDGVNVSRDNVIGSVSEGEIVTILNHDVARAWADSVTGAWHSDVSAWVNIRTAGGRDGWIYIRLLDLN